MTNFQLEVWSERAAIREFEGEQDRKSAERKAWKEMYPRLAFPGDEQQLIMFPINPETYSKK